MRIVHDVDTPMRCGGGGTPYSCAPGFQGYNGLRMDLLACTDCAGNHPDLPQGMFGGEGEVLHIEGDSKYVRKILEDLLHIVEITEKHYLEHYGENRTMGCPNCPDKGAGKYLHAADCPKHPNYEVLKVEYVGE